MLEGVGGTLDLNLDLQLNGIGWWAGWVQECIELSGEGGQIIGIDYLRSCNGDPANKTSFTNLT